MNEDDLTSVVPDLAVGEWIDTGVDWLNSTFREFFRAVADVVDTLITGLIDAMLLVPPDIMILVFALLGLLLRSWQFAIGSALGLAFVVSMGMWIPAVQTLALVVIATAVAVLIAIPIGILAARNKVVSNVVRPVLDFMQTMPAFVYLIPAILFFSIGYVPGMFATILFALPPGVRLTELGIRQVDSETVEAGQAFGATPRQILRGIQMPLAVPTIMAGVNQVIMLALSMAVVAGMVGADGLGKKVVESISTINIGLGAEAGLSVVVLAIYLDRLTASIGGSGTDKSLANMVRRSRTRSVAQRATTGI
ncbi:ABC transporter permease [Ornithinimicrobium faecis]|uniref:Proline/glycine betaine ABC transporter permease n=1 Tax=Ornithinimicrobium faecis TaxID=2934158 RepID=A0ABY4YVY2_9MICO|nr:MULTISPECIES: proline/glycine betaine ABC transporter permease [unclassified Ornithinimicrobium]USQ80640.1 proline/glycine betaine ABC transporter permease [Ornithinimicrobium sp. HY1793]